MRKIVLKTCQINIVENPDGTHSSEDSLSAPMSENQGEVI